MDKLQRPCSVFATFESEEGRARALRYNELVSDDDDFRHWGTMLGQEIDIQEAAEPSDIIWENRAYTDKQRKIKKGVITLVIMCMLGLSFSIIFVC